MKKHIVAGIFAVAGLIATAVYAAEPPWSPVEVSIVEDGKGGFKFTNDKGMPFFTNDKDKNDKIACADDCTGLTWLPVWARSRSEPQGNWSIVIRPDMSKQWAYKGVPIYQYNGEADDLEDAVKKDGHWHALAF
jgi:predicted lipoprotein with Yx(FWY)xxD motif